MTAAQESSRVFCRRTVVAAVGAAGVAAVLTACGGSDQKGAGHAVKPAGGGGAALAKTSEIPEGGGKIIAGRGIVVTQPTPGTFKAFSSTCTHQGCTVASVSDGTIHCPCHGSRFAVADGSVQHSPATEPLPAVAIKVDGGSITLG